MKFKEIKEILGGLCKDIKMKKGYIEITLNKKVDKNNYYKAIYFEGDLEDKNFMIKELEYIKKELS